MKQRSFHFLLPLLLLLVSCAQMVTPGGGPADRTAPRVVKYLPDSAQLQFEGKRIEVVFDEYIQLKDLNSSLVISPPLAKTPDISVKGKTLSIELDKNEQLKPNTTYCISFGNAVQDINESNPIENFQYLFSTGNFIDSLKISGQVETAFDHKREKGLLVLLYASNDDSAVYKQQPDYFSKTKADGSFQINNVRSGSYRLYALKDLNGNFRYDAPAEHIAFVATPVEAGNKEKQELKLFQEKSKVIHLKRYSHEQYGKVSLYFDQPSDSIRINLLNNTDRSVQEFVDANKTGDTVDLWLKNFQKDSLYLQVSNGNTILDTVELKWIKMEDALRSKKHPLKLQLVASPDGNENTDLHQAIALRLSQRLNDGEQSGLVLIRENGGGWVAHGVRMLRDQLLITAADTTVGNKSASKTDWKENTVYDVLIPSGKLQDIYGNSNDSIKIHFKTKPEKFYGHLKLNLDLPEGTAHYLIYLLDEKENMIRQSACQGGKSSREFEFLYPQKYKLKLVEDRNNDGKWNSGDLLKKLQAEPVMYHKETFTIRSNWDLELDWKPVQ